MIRITPKSRIARSIALVHFQGIRQGLREQVNRLGIGHSCRLGSHLQQIIID